MMNERDVVEPNLSCCFLGRGGEVVTVGVGSTGGEKGVMRTGMDAKKME